jgi:hypothetical protein
MRGMRSTRDSDEHIPYIQSITFTYSYKICRLRKKYLTILGHM